MEEISFIHRIFEFTKSSFVLLVWSQGAFFSLDAGSSHVGDEKGVDELAIDAYELAISKYRLRYPKEEELIEIFQIPIREEAILAEWRNKVSKDFMFCYFFLVDAKHPYS